MHRLASLVSGGGSTMEEIAKAARSGEIPDLELACVVASRADAGAVARARALGIPEKDIVVVSRRTHGEAFARVLLETLGERGVTVVTQNGWMVKTPEEVIAAYEGRIFNQHPGSPEDVGGQGMYGKRVHAAMVLFRKRTKRALATAMIAQRVHTEYDRGAVVQRTYVPVEDDDTPETLQARALPVEHAVQIALLQDFVRGTLRDLPPESVARPEEQELLEECKREAMALYPRG